MGISVSTYSKSTEFFLLKRITIISAWWDLQRCNCLNWSCVLWFKEAGSLQVLHQGCQMHHSYHISQQDALRRNRTPTFNSIPGNRKLWPSTACCYIWNFELYLMTATIICDSEGCVAIRDIQCILYSVYYTVYITHHKEPVLTVTVCYLR